MASLLAVDLGLRTGLAIFGRDGRLAWYRSHHYGNRSQLRQGVEGLLDEIGDVERVVVEGGGPIARVWERACARRSIVLRAIAAGHWRGRFFLPSDGTDRRAAKRRAGELARLVIDWSEAPKPVSLRHDTAEAVLIGLWGVLDAGWLDRPPDALRAPR